MKKRLRATLTVVHEYEADSKNYDDCESADDMIKIDKQNFDDDPMMFIEAMMDDEKSLVLFDVEEVSDETQPKENE